MDDYDSEDGTAAAMAAAMGFSSFGGNKTNKRRKFNHNTDDAGGASASTGSNMTPLGVRNSSNMNTDEIELDMEDDEGQGQGGQPTIPAHPTTQQNDGDQGDFEPQFIDTSRPSAPLLPTALVDEFQAKIDAIVSGSAEPIQPSSALNGSALPVRDGSHGGVRRHDTKRDGDRSGPKWWENYYDPASIVNPWEKLEQDNGLEPRGRWLSWEEAKAKTPQA
ncbi:hypothetical protein F5Y17DRAFT_108327 [Xylariaceae sp. FL0594]|nr:hypothetical protein F5Y17DRAFT_108327 [Xylariaceae sp. FL0594]